MCVCDVIAFLKLGSQRTHAAKGTTQAQQKQACWRPPPSSHRHHHHSGFGVCQGEGGWWGVVCFLFVCLDAVLFCFVVRLCRNQACRHTLEKQLKVSANCLQCGLQQHKKQQGRNAKDKKKKKKKKEEGRKHTTRITTCSLCFCLFAFLSSLSFVLFVLPSTWTCLQTRQTLAAITKRACSVCVCVCVRGSW